MWVTDTASDNISPMGVRHGRVVQRHMSTHMRRYDAFTTQIAPVPGPWLQEKLNELSYCTTTSTLGSGVSNPVKLKVTNDGSISFSNYVCDHEYFAACMNAVEKYLGEDYAIRGKCYVFNDYGGGVAGRQTLLYTGNNRDFVISDMSDGDDL